MGGSSTQKTTSEPWSEAQPALKKTIAEGQRLYDSDIGFKPWQGATLAGIDPRTTAALNETTNIASGMGGILGKTNYNFANDLVKNNGMSADQRMAMGGLLDTASGKYLSNTNPHLQAMIDANSDNVANRVSAAASSMGRFGSGAHTGVLTKEISNATLPILAQNYENERQRQIAASGQAASLFGQGSDRAMQLASMGSDLTDALYDPSRRLGAVGDYYGARSQAELDAERAKYEQEQARPWQMLGNLQNVAQGIGGLGGTTTQTQSGGGLLGGLLGAANIGLSLGGGMAGIPWFAKTFPSVFGTVR